MYLVIGSDINQKTVQIIYIGYIPTLTFSIKGHAGINERWERAQGADSSPLWAPRRQVYKSFEQLKSPLGIDKHSKIKSIICLAVQLRRCELLFISVMLN
jgi:hypothetical protein